MAVDPKAVVTEVPHEELTWTVSLGDRMPLHRIVVIVIAVGAGLFGMGLFQMPLFGIFAFCAVILSTAELYFPLRYKLSQSGASVTCGLSKTEVQWDKVQRIIEGPDGVKLSPLTSKTRLEPFRGVYLRFQGNEEAVRKYIDLHLTAAE